MENEPAHAVPIVIPDEKNRNKFLFEEDAMERILLEKDIADRTAVVVSVTGVYRQGKSFLLNFFLRYLESMSSSSDEELNDWLGDEDSPLEGFSWRGGDERNTTGILMWSKIFKVDLPTGKKAAVILLDTQGTFDDKSTVRECATVFALSTMLSSIQIFNLFHNLQEDHLQHLELFAEYGKLFVHDNDHSPFQKLQFLVRDWSYPYQRNYGPEGGRTLLESRLQITDQQAPQQRSLRENIRSCFTDIQCFLMPHPGLRVATNLHFDGRLSDIDDEFKTYMRQFVPMLISVENLVLKEIGGQQIKATAEANILSAVATARDYFNNFMLNAFENNKPYLTPEELGQVFQNAKSQAIEQFDEKPKMGGDELIQNYRSSLIEGMENDYTRSRISNEVTAEASNQLGYAAGKECYTQNMASICENAKPYLKEDQFTREHEENRQLALIKFGNNCRPGEDSVSDKYKADLERFIIIERNRFYAVNKNKANVNNRAASITSKEQYYKKMTEILQNTNETFFSSEKLEQIHVKFRTEAVEYFNTKCIPNGDEFSDKYRIDLIKGINEDFEYLKSFNKNKNESFILSTTAAVKETYHRGMTAVCEAAFPYLTNDQLDQEHLRCQTEAMQKYNVHQEFYESYENELKEYIETDYDGFKNFNKTKADAHNQLAYSSAKEYYYRQMNMLFEGPQRYFNQEEFQREHQKCKTEALEQFATQCRISPDEFSETYRIKLEEEIEMDCEWFQNHNKTKANFARSFPNAKRNDVARDVLSGATAGATIIGTAAAGPAGALFGAVWGGIMGRGFGEWLRRK